MKEPSLFDPLYSSQLPFIDPPLATDLFEQEKIPHPSEELQPPKKHLKQHSRSHNNKKPTKSMIKNKSEDNPEIKQSKIKEKKYKTMSQERQRNPNQLFGHWSPDQNKKYHWFLEIHHVHFMNRSLRRMDRIFTSMATFVGSREAEQCRSHHQKMEKKHKNFPKILLSLRSSYYGSYEVDYLADDIEKNSIEYKDGLLSEKELVQHGSSKDLSNDLDMSKDEGKSEDEIEEKPLKSEEKGEEKTKNTIEEPVNDLIEEMMGPDVESSKNYFKFLSGRNERNNILDDGYESNLPFDHMF